jgi:P pilus assembly chaperone PapD
MNLFRMPVMRKLAICLLAVLMLSLLSVCSRSAVAVLHTHPIAPGSAK